MNCQLEDWLSLQKRQIDPTVTRKVEIWSPKVESNTEYEVTATHLGTGSEWSSSYQIVLTEPAEDATVGPDVLDGKIIVFGKVQNNTDEDWNNISLNLHTGCIKQIGIEEDSQKKSSNFSYRCKKKGKGGGWRGKKKKVRRVKVSSSESEDFADDEIEGEQDEGYVDKSYIIEDVSIRKLEAGLVHMFEKSINVKRHLMYRTGDSEVEHGISWQNNCGLLEEGPCAVIEKNFRGEMVLDRMTNGQWAQISYACEEGVAVQKNVLEGVVFTAVKFKKESSDIGFCDPKEAKIVVKEYTTNVKTIYEVRNKSTKAFPDLLITHVKRRGFKISPYQIPKAIHSKRASESTFLVTVPLPGEKSTSLTVLEFQTNTSNIDMDDVLTKEEYTETDWVENRVLTDQHLQALNDRRDKKRLSETLQKLLLNSFARHAISLPDPIKTSVDDLTNFRRKIKHIHEVTHEINLLVKKKMRNSRRIFENLKSLQTGNSMSEKLREELNQTIMETEKDIGKLMVENAKNTKRLKDYRKQAVELGKGFRKLVREQLIGMGQNVEDTSDESDDFGPDPILEDYERRIRKLFKRNREQDTDKIKSTLQKLRFKFANNPKQLYMKVCRSYGEDFNEEDYEDYSDDEGDGE